MSSLLLLSLEKLEESHGYVLNDRSACPSHKKPRTISSRCRLCVRHPQCITVTH